MKLKNLLFVFCLALLAGCQKDPDTESAPARDTDRVEGVIRMKLDRETAEALNVTRTRSGRVLTGNISFDELCKRYEVTGMSGCSPTTAAPSEHARQGSTCGMSFVSKDLPSRSPKTSERLPA